MDKQDDREVTQSGNGELSEDVIYWLALEIIQDRFKDVPKRLIAKIAERVTTEPIPPDLSQQKIRSLLSRRITAEVRSMGEKAPEPVGHDHLLTVGAKRQDRSGFADTFSNTTEGDPNSNYGDLIDNRLSKLNLAQNERRLVEQEQAKAQLDHIKRGVSPKSRAILQAIQSKGGPNCADTNYGIAKEIGVDHKEVDRCLAEARKAAGEGWRIFTEPKEQPASNGPQKVFRGAETATTGIAVKRHTVPLETIRETSGMPAVALFGGDRRTRVGTNPTRYTGEVVVTEARKPRPKLSELERLERRARRFFVLWKECVHNRIGATECEKCKNHRAEWKRLEVEVRRRRAT